jgi:hypothetical protein
MPSFLPSYPGLAAYHPEKYIEGLSIENPSTTTRLITPGICITERQDFIQIARQSLLVDAADNGAGGLDVGALAANTWYALYVVSGPNRPEQGVFSTDFDEPALIGWPNRRRIGVARTDATALFKDLRLVSPNGARGREWSYEWVTNSSIFNNVGSTFPTFTDLNFSAQIPPTSTQPLVALRMRSASSTQAVFVFRPRGAPPTLPPTQFEIIAPNGRSSIQANLSTDAEQMAQFAIIQNDASPTLAVATTRFTDPV